MALSGSFNTTSYDGRYYTLSWTATQSIANNQSTISWTLSCAGGSNWYAERTLKATLGGKTLVDKTDRVERYKGTISTGSFTLTHNSTGGLSISGSVSAAVYTSSVNCTGSDSWTLNTIPRQANISTAPNFNDEANPSITYSNPAGSAVTSLDACISLTGSKDDVPYRAISKTGTSYTFNLTDAERATLRNACTTANSRTVKFYVRTVVGGTTFYSILDRTLSIVNANPTFTAVAADTMEESLALTDDNSKIIRGYNIVAASITAAAYKGATISSYKIVNGGTTVNAATGIFTNAESGSFSFEVTDSRGNKATDTITLDMINYVPLTVNLDGRVTLSSSDSTKADASFIISGNYFNGTFGAVDNYLQGSYVLESSNGETIEGQLDIPTEAMDGNTYKASLTIADLDYRNTYVVSVVYSDAIYKNIAATSKTLKTTPIFDWGESDFNFNVPINMNGNTILRDSADYGHTVLAANGGSVYIRPNGADNSEGELRVYPNGTVSINGSNMADYVVERGTYSAWTYEKWASGKAVCYGATANNNYAITSAYGKDYYISVANILFPPSLFIEEPNTITVTPLCSSGLLKFSVYYLSKDGFSGFLSDSVSSTKSVSLRINVIGRWK